MTENLLIIHEDRLVFFWPLMRCKAPLLEVPAEILLLSYMVENDKS